jgi:hypothetical protein
MIQFSGTNSIAITAYVASNTGGSNVSATGTYTLSSDCTATASLTDTLGIDYTLMFQFTSASGNNFILSSASVQGMYTASGRSL